MPRRRERCQALDQIAEVVNHLRRAAGKIDNGNISPGQPIDDAIDRFTRHDFLALRSGVHMAMCAHQVAKLANVDLKDLRASPTQTDRMLPQFLREPIHPFGNQQQLPPSQHSFGSVVTSYSWPLVSFGCRSSMREQSNGFASASGTSTIGSTISKNSRYGAFLKRL